MIKTIRFLMKNVLWEQVNFLWRIKKNRRTLQIPDWVDTVFLPQNQIIKPIQVVSELTDFLLVIKKEAPKTVLEIGTANGGTLFLFSRIIPCDSHFICVDLPQIPMMLLGKSLALFRTFFFKAFLKRGQRVDLIWKDSHSEKTKAIVQKRLKGKCVDLLYIDGDHSYEGVKRDFELYFPLVKPDGLIVFHDIVFHPPGTVPHPAEVDIFWKKIRERFFHIELVENWNQWWAGIGIISKTPFDNSKVNYYKKKLKTFSTCSKEKNWQPIIRIFNKQEIENRKNDQKDGDDEQKTIDLKMCRPLGYSPFFVTLFSNKPDLNRIDFIFGTYLRTNPGMVCLKIWINPMDKKKEPDRKVFLKASELMDNQFASFKFEPIRNSERKEMLLSLEMKEGILGMTPGIWCGDYN